MGMYVCMGGRDHPDEVIWAVGCPFEGRYAITEWKPQGKRIGWVDSEQVYLEPEASYAEAQTLAEQQGERIEISAQTLRKRLHERHLLASTDCARETLTIRRQMEGRQRAVLHLRAGSLSLAPKKPDIPDTTPKPGVNGHHDVRFGVGFSGGSEAIQTEDTPENSGAFASHVGNI